MPSNADRPEMTPEDALEASSMVASAFGEELGLEVPPMLVSMFAAMALVLQDVSKGDCTCDPCVRLRELEITFGEMMDGAA
jgi:hypothetical protein